jgi:hypothetical protein
VKYLVSITAFLFLVLPLFAEDRITVTRPDGRKIVVDETSDRQPPAKAAQQQSAVRYKIAEAEEVILVRPRATAPPMYVYQAAAVYAPVKATPVVVVRERRVGAGGKGPIRTLLCLPFTLLGCGK